MTTALVRVGLLVAAAILVDAEAVAQTTTVKLATLVPDGSLWHKALKEMGSSWQEKTQGRVALKLYPGGVAGDDPDMVRKMRIGQIQAASVSVIGLAEIDPAFNVFAIPLFFENSEEMRHVLKKLEPDLKRRLADKGFVLLNWGYGGEIHVFSKKAVRTVEEMKSIKMFAAAGDDRWVTWWKANGFRPVALATTDILTGLQTGLIDAYPTTPLAALSLQWFRQTPYMLDIGLAPLLGATVMPTKAWEKIPEKDREIMLAAALRVEERLLAEVPKQDASAVSEMEKRGLTIIRVSQGPASGGWHKTAEDLAQSMRSKMIEASIFDAAKTERDAYRRSGEGGVSR